MQAVKTERSDRRYADANGKTLFPRLLLPGVLCCLLQLLLSAGCGTPVGTDESTAVTFAVIDVGQGLSQLLVRGDRAILFDAGEGDSARSWIEAYRDLGSPRLEAVVLSHRDLDHTGGLRFLDGSVRWSGRLIAGRWEDTALIRARCSNRDGSIRIRTIAQGDSIYFTDNCLIDCRWPRATAPDSVPVPDEEANNGSVVLSIRYHHTTVLLTGDIDSVAARTIAGEFQTALQADIVVVPHHGSASSACPLFYGYVHPATAVISFGENNGYGHPAPLVTDLLARQGIRFRTTADAGTVVFRSNGFYWEEQ